MTELRTLLVAALACVGAAVAVAQTAPSQATPAETWVGTWAGKVTWKECSVDSGANLSLPIESVAGALTSDGDLLLDGLGPLTWSTSGKTLVIARDGLDVALARGKKGAIKLTLKTAAGCVGKATLKRASSGMPSCDAVRALAQVKSTCGGVDEATRGDDLVEIDGAWKAWKKLKGKKKKAQAKQCTARLSGLRTEVASCAPTGAAIALTGTYCEQMMKIYDALLVCAAIPQDQRDQIQQVLPLLQQQATEDMCKSVVESTAAALPALGCPIP